jgi:acetoin utilization deacetylase AcuC-like enzyme
MPRVGYVYDPLYLEHEYPGHPERPDRLRAILAHMETSGLLARMTKIAPRDATTVDLALVHDRALITHLASLEPGARAIWLDADTYVSARSYAAALRSAGGVLAAVDAVMEGTVDSAFCFVRPPGHHATPSQAMGFCLFNNVAVAAAHLLERTEVERVAIVDFDVHHGNGTQDIFYAAGRVLYFSTHQFPHYPGTGRVEEAGEGAGAGCIINVPLPAGCGDVEAERAYREVCAPAIRRFAPQIILVSAGFDAHFADPLAQLLFSARGYYEIGTLLKELADELCGGWIVYALEGGYDLDAISWSAGACVQALLGEEFSEDTLGAGPGVRGPNIDGVIGAARAIHRLDYQD